MNHAPARPPQQRPERTQRLAKQLVKRPRATLTVLAALAVFAGIELLGLELDPATERIFPEHHPALAAFQQFRKDFGDDEFIVLAYEAPQSALSRPELARLERLTTALEAIRIEVEDKGVRRTLAPIRAVRSLTSAPAIRLAMFGPQLGRVFPGSVSEMNEAAFNQARQALRESPFIKPALLSEDERATALVIEVERAAENLADGGDKAVIALVKAVRACADRELGAVGIRPHIAGSPVVKEQIVDALGRDILVFIAPLFVIAALVSFAVFRNLYVTFIPLLIIILTDLFLLGFMGFAGIPIRPMTSLLPPLLFVVGIADSIHVLIEIQVMQQAFGPGHDRAEVVAAALTDTLKPCFVTLLTTAIGFGSLALSDIAPIREFGLFAALGAAIAFAMTFTVIPALWMLAPASLAIRTTEAPRTEGLASFALKSSAPFAVLGVVLTVLGVVKLNDISYNTDYVGFFHKDSDLRRAADFIQDRFAGIGAVELVVSGAPGQLRDPKVLEAMLAFERELRALPEVDTAISVADFVLIAQGLIAKEPGLPKTVAELERMERLFTGLAGSGRELRRFLSAGLDRTRISARVRTMGSDQVFTLLDQIRALSDRHFGGFTPKLTVIATGTPVIFSETARFMLEGQFWSFVSALATIGIVMVLTLRSLRLGLLSIPANLFPIIMTFGLMSLLEIPLNSFNSMVASVAIGIAVDDTIHVMIGYQRFRARLPLEAALHETLSHTGAAVVSTSVLLTAGFAVLCLGSFKPTAHFGFLTSVAIIAALYGDLFIQPSLIRLDERIFGGPAIPAAPPAAPAHAT